MRRINTIILHGSIPSKKNSRINLPDGRSFPSDRYRKWEEGAKWIVKNTIKEPLSGEVEVAIITTLRNDLDNLASSIMDMLEGIAYQNDRQVNRLIIVRIKGSQKTTHISVRSSRISGHVEGDTAKHT